MTTKLATSFWVLALSFSVVLAAPAERAVEVPLKPNSMAATKPTTTKSGKAVTRKATVSRPDSKTAPRVGRDSDPTISRSIHDWVPRTATKASHTRTEPAEAGRKNRKNRVAASERAVEVKP